MNAIRKYLLPVLVILVSITVAGDAMAAKEKFERTKPHVNIGTIGHVDRSAYTIWITVGVYETGIERSDPDSGCSGILDIKLSDPTDRSGALLAELNGIRLEPGFPLSSQLPVRDTADGPVNLVVLAREMEVDGRTCLFRGAVEVRDIATGETTKFAPLKPAEFIILKPAEEGEPDPSLIEAVDPDTQ